MAKQALTNKFQSKHKAYEGVGPTVRVAVLAVKGSRPFAHLGGYFKYNPNQTPGTEIGPGNMCHQSGFAFPADGKMHEYEFPQEFAARLMKQAEGLPDAFEVSLLAPEAPKMALSSQFAGGHKEAPTTEPLEEDELEDDEEAADDEDDQD